MNVMPISRRSHRRAAATITAVGVAWLLFGPAGVALAEQGGSPGAGSQTADEPPPLPAKPIILNLPLRYISAGTAAEVLNQAYGSQVRLAVDKGRNTLIVLSPDRQTANSVTELVERLDAEASDQAARRWDEHDGRENMQLQVVWVADGLPDDVGTEPKAHDMSAAVLDALHDLGLAHPKVLGRDLTTLASPREVRSEFAFKIPVNINTSSFTFQGKGSVSGSENGGMWSSMYAIGRGQYLINLDVKITGLGGESQMSGSMITPPGHYVVLGTTDFVFAVLGAPKYQRYPSAFVVCLEEVPTAGR